MPTTGKGAVELWSVALYAIYHDYGCRYLRFILDSNNEPSADMDELLRKSRRHINNVQRVLRTNVAHGTLDAHTPDELKRIFFPRENEALEEIPENQWFRVAEKICKESDALVDVLYKWADGYRESTTIRNQFGSSGDFTRSIDSRIVFDTLDNDLCGRGDKRAIEILDKASDASPAEKLEVWRSDISTLFLKEEIKTPQDIIDKLKSYLFEVHQPEQRSSVTIGESLGFSLSDLLKK